MEIGVDDLRSQKRLKGSHGILISYPSQDGSEKLVQHTCSTQDISESGLKIVVRRPLPLGKELPIEVTIGDEEAVFKFYGEVKWCLEVDPTPTYYAGIKLTRIVENQYENWLAIVARAES
ncbi:PilZ domain-containing protein [Aliikangiella marina]|uniref:PilZ domain-containing protein n=1 Tax=Aliikangiella marina TaxID=1712262 RepID=A0A545TIA5_9GAMM|nr:PilZ domain-containing protein [Aliikangiella marina]TQV76906.1 PilZ domain-containing protein [Aliikangiella marina]